MVKDKSIQIDYETPVDQLSYEQAVSQLEEVINSLEAGEQSLEESVKLFERGKALSQYCARLLEGAELKVKQISGEDLVPYDPEG